MEKKKIPRSSQGTIVSHELILHLGQLKRSQLDLAVVLFMQKTCA